MEERRPSISQELAAVFTEVLEVVENINSPFSSHEFIQEFSHRNEALYLSFLARYQQQNGVRAVNSQIGRFLSVNSGRLNIQRTGKTNDGNFFGKKSGNERWVRI